MNYVYIFVALSNINHCLISERCRVSFSSKRIIDTVVFAPTALISS